MSFVKPLGPRGRWFLGSFIRVLFFFFSTFKSCICNSLFPMGSAAALFGQQNKGLRTCLSGLQQELTRTLSTVLYLQMVLRWVSSLHTTQPLSRVWWESPRTWACS